MRKRIIAVVLSALLAVVALAHPGRTDSKGGHTNHSTGEYHYHHGYPEHQHPGGVCPYDFDGKTGESSTTSKREMSQESKDKLNAYYDRIEAALAEEKPTGSEKRVWVIVKYIIGWVLFVVLLVYGVGCGVALYSIIALLVIPLFKLIASLFKRKK
jgi:hypothetical protein